MSTRRKNPPRKSNKDRSPKPQSDPPRTAVYVRPVYEVEINVDLDGDGKMRVELKKARLKGERQWQRFKDIFDDYDHQDSYIRCWRHDGPFFQDFTVTCQQALIRKGKGAKTVKYAMMFRPKVSEQIEA